MQSKQSLSTLTQALRTLRGSRRMVGISIKRTAAVFFYDLAFRIRPHPLQGLLPSSQTHVFSDSERRGWRGPDTEDSIPQLAIYHLKTKVTLEASEIHKGH